MDDAQKAKAKRTRKANQKTIAEEKDSSERVRRDNIRLRAELKAMKFWADQIKKG